jgi:hypothetical protein
MVNDIPFATCPQHNHAQQASTQHRSARAGQYHEQSGTVRPHRKSPGGEVCPDTALNCSLTGIRSSNQSTLFACTSRARRVPQTLMPVWDRVWTYKAGFRAPRTGHHQIHRTKSMRLRLVHPSELSRQPMQSDITGSVSGLPATARSSQCSRGQTVEARRTIGRQMPPEPDRWTGVLHNHIRQAYIVARDPKTMVKMAASRFWTETHTRDVQGARRSLIDTNPRSRTQGSESRAMILTNANRNANVTGHTAVAMASAPRASSRGSNSRTGHLIVD